MIAPRALQAKIGAQPLLLGVSTDLHEPPGTGATISSKNQGDRARRRRLVGVAAVLALGAITALFLRSSSCSPRAGEIAPSNATIVDAGVNPDGRAGKRRQGGSTP
jgi:hypothetical protein